MLYNISALTDNVTCSNKRTPKQQLSMFILDNEIWPAGICDAAGRNIYDM